LLAWIVLALAVFALGAPFIHGDRFQRQIRAALEGALGRKIEIGAVTLTLLSGPGFEVQNVIIGEDPAFGIEHFAYTDSMRVRLSLRTLWTRRVQVASLTLINPSINLVKNAQGRWNFEALLERARARAPADHPPGPRNDITSGQSYFPYIGIQGGRVNFKFGDYKSIFHFQNVEAALSPARDAQGRWSVRFEGTPARADRLLSGMGIVKAEGEWSTGPGLVRIELSLAPSPLEHLLTLFNGRDIGVHGEVSARTLLRGPVSDVKVQGSLETGDFHRWDLLPSRGSDRSSWAKSPACDRSNPAGSRRSDGHQLSRGARLTRWH
jgi:AsmA protein